MVQLSHPYMTTGKTTALTTTLTVGKVISLLFNTLSRLVIAFLPRSKYLLISWLQLPLEVILEPQNMKSINVSFFFPHFLPLIDGTGCHNVKGPDVIMLVFWVLSFKPAFSLSSFTFIKRLFSSSSISAVRMVSSARQGYWYFSRQSWFHLELHPA